MKKLSVGKIIFRYALLAVVCVIIYKFSENDGTQSTMQSSRIVNLICRVFFPDLNAANEARQLAVTDILTVIVRKGAHLAVYTLLGAVSFAAFFIVRSKGIRYFLAVLFTFVYACTDEFHQTLIADRTGKPSDVIIDAFGGAVGALIVLAAVIVLDAARITRELKSQPTQEKST